MNLKLKLVARKVTWNNHNTRKYRCLFGKIQGLWCFCIKNNVFFCSSVKMKSFCPKGVTKHVGDALLLERSQRTGRVNTLGIAPWGIVENNHELIGHNTEVPYHSISSPR